MIILPWGACVALPICAPLSHARPNVDLGCGMNINMNSNMNSNINMNVSINTNIFKATLDVVDHAATPAGPQKDLFLSTMYTWCQRFKNRSSSFATPSEKGDRGAHQDDANNSTKTFTVIL